MTHCRRENKQITTALKKQNDVRMLSYTKPRATLQQLLLKQHLPSGTSTNVHVQNVLQRLKICRTAALGYHVYRCSDEQCGHIKY